MTTSGDTQVNWALDINEPAFRAQIARLRREMMIKMIKSTIAQMAQLRAGVQDYLARRRAYHAMQGLSDRELADIGFSRAMLWQEIKHFADAAKANKTVKGPLPAFDFDRYGPQNPAANQQADGAQAVA